MSNVNVCTLATSHVLASNFLLVSQPILQSRGSLTPMDSLPTLQVVLPSQVTSSQPELGLSFEVSIHNSAKKMVTLLNWGTPLDPLAGPLGVFEVRDTKSDSILPIDVIMIKRQLPPSADDLIEIGGSSSVDIIVQLPPLPISAGHDYSIRACGRYYAVWDSPRKDISKSQLLELSGASSGEFTSNTAALNIE